MKKNVSGQEIGTQMVSATDGSNFTGAVTVYITKDGGTQTIGSVASGVCTHKGKGYHEYSPSQSETNANHIAFTFEGTGAVTTTVQVDTESSLFSNNIVLGTGVSGVGPSVIISAPSSSAGAYADWSGCIFVVEDTDDTASLCVRQIVEQIEDDLALNDSLTFTPTGNSRYWILAGSSLEVGFNNKLPVKSYLTGTDDPLGCIDCWGGSVSESEAVDFSTADRTRLIAIYNKLPGKSFLTGTNNSDGDIQINEVTGVIPHTAFSYDIAQVLDPRLLTAGVIDYIQVDAGVTEIGVIDPDYWSDPSGLAGCTILANNGSEWVHAVIQGAVKEDDTVRLFLYPFSGVFIDGSDYVIIAPSSLESGSIKQIWESDPSVAFAGFLAAGSAGSTSVQASTTYGSWASAKPGDIAKLHDVSTGITHFHRVSYTSYPSIILENPITFNAAAYVDTFEVVKDPLIYGTPSPKFILDTLYDKMPTSNYLAGSSYPDGTINTGDINDLEGAIVSGVQAALDGSDIAFSVEALNTMRDHFYGGKLFIESAVDDSAVTPTITSFAGGGDLSSANDFYSKTNSVLAFTTGNLQGLCGLVVDYDGATRRFYFDGVWPAAPAAGDQFVLLGKITTQA